MKKQFIPKGSQFSDEEYELSAFEKKEYELLTSTATKPKERHIGTKVEVR
jgi:hypothetical protein